MTLSKKSNLKVVPWPCNKCKRDLNAPGYMGSRTMRAPDYVWLCGDCSTNKRGKM